MRLTRPFRFFLAGLLFGLASSTAATAAGIREDAIGLDFPERLGGLALKGRTQFPRAGDGASIAYEREAVRGAIYVYDAGISPIPDGVGPVTQKHFLQTEMALRQASKQGPANTRITPVKGSTISAFPGCGPQFMWRSDAIDMDGHRMITRTYLAGYHDRFVKLRVTHPRGEDEAAEAFVQAARKLLGKCG